MTTHSIEIQSKIERIAKQIRSDWGAKISPYARPYLNAMINSDYGYDGAYDVVARFLSNASGYRGELARTLKADLKQILKQL